MTCKTPITYLVVNENFSIDFKIHIIRHDLHNITMITIIYVFSSSRSDRAFLIEKKVNVASVFSRPSKGISRGLETALATT